MQMGGYTILESIEHVVQRQYRFPKSKKRRIQKKWKTQNKNYKTEAKEPILMNICGSSTIIMHPSQVKQLKESYKWLEEMKEPRQLRQSTFWATEYKSDDLFKTTLFSGFDASKDKDHTAFQIRIESSFLGSGILKDNHKIITNIS